MNNVLGAMNEFDFYKELYLNENDRRTAVNDALSIPIAIVTALVSIAFFLLTTFDYGQSGKMLYLFLGLSALSVVLISVSVYSLIRAFSNLIKGYEYKGLPYPQELLDWHQALVKHYSTHGSGAAQADDIFRKHLIKKYAEHADYNMRVNDQKTKHVFTAKRYTVLALVSLALTCFPYGRNYFYKTPEIHKVEVVHSTTSLKEQAIPTSTNQTTGNERRENSSSGTTPATSTTQGSMDSRGESATTSLHTPATTTTADTTTSTTTR